jgi:hypothetical protein
MKALSYDEASIYAPYSERSDMRRLCEEFNRKADALIRRRGGRIETPRDVANREATAAIAKRDAKAAAHARLRLKERRALKEKIALLEKQCEEGGAS